MVASRTLEPDGGEGAGEGLDLVAEGHKVGEVLGTFLQGSSDAGGRVKEVGVLVLVVVVKSIASSSSGSSSGE